MIFSSGDNYHKMRNIAVFASGSGTNAENIIKYFSTGMDFMKPDPFSAVLSHIKQI